MTQLLTLLKTILRTEPALVIGVTVAGVVAVAGAFGIVLDTQSVTSIVAEVVAILAGAIATRSKVTPV